MTSVKHTIVHMELSTRDRLRDAKFYTELFDWEFQQMPEMNYATFELGESLGGGLNPVTDEFQAGTTIVYISTDDIDATLAHAASLGGKIVRQRTEIPGYGWFGLFTDLSDNLIGLYTANSMEA